MEYENQDMPVDVAEEPKPREMNEVIEVRAITKKGGMMLAQWEQDDRLHRAWFRDSDMTKIGESYYVVDPHVGIPYGFDFTELVELKTTPKVLDRELKRRGIWTLDDLRADPAALSSAIQAAYGVTRGTILQKAEEYEKELRKSLSE